jgi:hypothetical protein
MQNNSISFIGDISKKTWKISGEWKDPSPWFRIGFTDNGNLPVFFNKLKFGMKIFLNEELINEYYYPEENGIEVVEYSCTYEDVMPHHFFLIPAIAGMVYKINVWAENSEIFFEKNFKIMIPLPDSMNPSAKNWNEKTKQYDFLIKYPKKIPKNGFYWAWDEKKEQWIQKRVPF